MTRIALFTQLQDILGRDQAQAVAQYAEDEQSQKINDLATRHELTTAKLDILKAVQKLQQKQSEGEVRLAQLESRLTTKMMQWSVIQLVTTVAALITLSKLL